MTDNSGIKAGDMAPDFILNDEKGQPVKLSGFRGKWVVLYFYPKDNTPGCTTEACDFSADKPLFDGLDAEILGVSTDSEKSHMNFILKRNLKIRLLSDPNHEVLERYGPWQEKNMFGKLLMGVVRSTYLIDPEGRVAHVWPKVKVKGHSEEVRKKIAQLQGKTE